MKSEDGTIPETELWEGFSGHLKSTTGSNLDENGRLVDAQGNLIDWDGNRIDENGYLLDSNGELSAGRDRENYINCLKILPEASSQ